MRKFANIISTMFHPLLMVTYGIILIVTFTYLRILPPISKLIIVGQAFLVTSLLPALAIYFMVKRGIARDYELTDRRERLLPYITIIAALLFYCVFLHKLRAFWITYLIYGAIAALVIAMFINFFWKISAHTLGIGGMLGGIFAISRMFSINPFIGIMDILVVGGLVATSRIYLGKHTPAQTYCGFLLGCACVYVTFFLCLNILFI
jgi:membrane-associated phospholipid phosphatase